MLINTINFYFMHSTLLYLCRIKLISIHYKCLLVQCQLFRIKLNLEKNFSCFGLCAFNVTCTCNIIIIIFYILIDHLSYHCIHNYNFRQYQRDTSEERIIKSVINLSYFPMAVLQKFMQNVNILAFIWPNSQEHCRHFCKLMPI